MKQQTPFLKEHYCPLCGKEFYPTPMWVYKDAGDIYCSWTCYRKRTNVADKKYNYKPIQQLSVDDEQVIAEFKNAYEAATELDCSLSGIRDACRLNLKYKGYLWRYKTDGVSEV